MKIKINVADKSVLLTVHGVGEALAENIINMRKILNITPDILSRLKGYRSGLKRKFDFRLQVIQLSVLSMNRKDQFQILPLLMKGRWIREIRRKKNTKESLVKRVNSFIY